MTQDRELDRILEEWLAPAGDRLPDRVLASALATTRGTRRARRWWPRLPGGGSSRPSLIPAVALVGILGAAGIASLGSRPDMDTLPTPPPAPASPALVEPGDPRDLAATWIGTGSAHDEGAWLLRLGSFATLQGPAGEIQVLQGFTVDGATLRLPGGTGACQHLPGTYRWRIDGDVLALTAIDDPCPDRAAPMESSRWTRAPEGWLVAHAFQAPFMAPADNLTLALQEVTTTLTGFGGLHVDGRSGVAAWIVERVLDDACSPAPYDPAQRPVEPRVEAVIERLRSVGGLAVDAPIPAVAAGRPATLVSITVTGESCGGPLRVARIWEDQGAGVGPGVSATNQYFEIALGGRADIFLVEVGDSVVAITTWADSGEPTTPERRALIDAIRFLDPAP